MQLTPNIVAYIAHEEGLVPEAYKDSLGIWTWALGVATTSGVDVTIYKDNPQPLDVCLRASITMMGQKYLPAVAAAFAGQSLTEAQIAAALSFHWNTGAIGKAHWVQEFCAGNAAGAEADILQWSSHGLLTARRTREQQLFFHGVWPNPMLAPVYGVAKPAYTPHGATPTDLMPVLTQIMTPAPDADPAAVAAPVPSPAPAAAPTLDTQPVVPPATP